MQLVNTNENAPLDTSQRYGELGGRSGLLYDPETESYRVIFLNAYTIGQQIEPSILVYDKTITTPMFLNVSEVEVIRLVDLKKKYGVGIEEAPNVAKISRSNALLFIRKLFDKTGYNVVFDFATGEIGDYILYHTNKFGISEEDIPNYVVLAKCKESDLEEIKIPYESFIADFYSIIYDI